MCYEMGLVDEYPVFSSFTHGTREKQHTRPPARTFKYPVTLQRKCHGEHVRYRVHSTAFIPDYNNPTELSIQKGKWHNPADPFGAPSVIIHPGTLFRDEEEIYYVM